MGADIAVISTACALYPLKRNLVVVVVVVVRAVVRVWASHGQLWSSLQRENLSQFDKDYSGAEGPCRLGQETSSQDLLLIGPREPKIPAFAEALLLYH